MKFSRELEAQLVHEWREGYVDYKLLKKIIKNIKVSLLSSSSKNSSGSELSYGFSIADPIRTIVARFSSVPDSQNRLQGDEEHLYELDQKIQSEDEEVKTFFERVDMELEKVNNFYARIEEGSCEKGEEVLKQLKIMLEVKQVLKESRHRRPRRRAPPLDAASPGSTGALLSGINSPSPVPVGTPMSTEEAPQQEQVPVVEEVIAALERNGLNFIWSVHGKLKKEAKPRADVIRIDIPATTPTLSFMNFWENLVNGLQKEGDGGNGYHLNRMKIQKAEKMIRDALVEVYKQLERMKKYSTLNLMAFTKIMKKVTKVTNEEEASACFMKKVKGSHFIVSDKVLRLQDEVESVFTKHFASNDRKIARISLKPQQNKDSHTITFFAGLFTGTFITLFSVYAILAHFCGIFTSTSTSGYVKTVYPVFSMFALISLHIFLYGCNLFMWKCTRINHNFIFDFKLSTALKHRDAFLISSAFMTTVVGAMVAHLFLKYNHISSHHLEALPGILLLILVGLLVCPFNIFYRDTRFCFLRVMRNIIFSPLYKVLMADFFMADQLTSQIPLLRYIEFTACYFITGGMKAGYYETCSSSHQYKLLAYVISFLPYYWRAMQCVRRYMEEGYDINHMANCGKYMSAMVAAAARMLYAMNPTPVRLALAIIACSGATLYQLYWDFVKDWGLLNPKSKNLFLRDKLILKKKCIYYFSMIGLDVSIWCGLDASSPIQERRFALQVFSASADTDAVIWVLNFVLRLAWIESVMRVNLGPVEHRLVDFSLASLEIIRRGHWNYYRLENEHLNNVGKFRTMKTVPLPFREMDSD